MTSVSLAGPKASSEDIAAGEERAQELLEEAGLGYPAKDVELKVYKAKRILELYVEGTLVKTYPIALGWNSEGHKRVEGDGRTPEGSYSIVTKHRSKFHLFMGVSYPNKDDASAGLDDGRISKSDHSEIIEASDEGKRPPWSTDLGGAIGVHGGGIVTDWTAGCIALENEGIEELYAMAKIGTPIIILP